MARIVLLSLGWLLTNAVEPASSSQYWPANLTLAPLHTAFFEPASCSVMPSYFSLKVDNLCVNERILLATPFASHRIFEQSSDHTVSMSLWVGANCTGQSQSLNLGRNQCALTDRIYWQSRGGKATDAAYSSTDLK